MNTPTINQLHHEKRPIFGECENLEAAREFAYQLLPEVSTHDLNEIIDVYHNTLISHLITTVKK